MDLRLHRLHEQHGRQRRVGAADVEAAQMELHFAREYLFEPAQAFDALTCARRLIEEQPVHLRLRGVQPRHGVDELPDGFAQRWLLARRRSAATRSARDASRG